MASISFDISNGDLTVQVIVTEQSDGTLQFDVTVDDTTGKIGDLNGLFFDLSNDSIADSLTVTGTDLTGSKIDADSVTKVSSWNNMNGEVIKEDGKYDVGVQFGSSGMAKDDIQSTSFTLATLDGSALSLADVAQQDFGVRLTSVGEIDGSRGDSLKISGSSPEVPEEEACANLGDDFIFSTSQNGVNLFGTEFLGIDANGAPITSVLANDENADGSAYSGAVFTAEGVEVVGQTTLTGSNGGELIVYADGSVDFVANGDFDYLVEGEYATTIFTYAAECGETADITVQVEWQDPNGGGVGF